jgi:hypothetical protein
VIAKGFATMSETPRLSLLAVCVPDLPQPLPQVDVRHVSTAREAMCRLRDVGCDLLVSADVLPDASVWTFVNRVRTWWPSQRWALVRTCMVSRDADQDEIQARALGALMVFNGISECSRLYELTRSLLKRTSTRHGPETSEDPTEQPAPSRYAGAFQPNGGCK